MADPITLLNYTLIDNNSIEQMTNRVNLMINFFRAIGGIFVIGIIIALWNIIQQRKQRRLLNEINKKLDKLTHKRK